MRSNPKIPTQVSIAMSDMALVDSLVDVFEMPRGPLCGTEPTESGPLDTPKEANHLPWSRRGHLLSYSNNQGARPVHQTHNPKAGIDCNERHGAARLVDVFKISRGPL